MSTDKKTITADADNVPAVASPKTASVDNATVAASSGVQKYKLSKTVKVADKTFDELTLDFDSLTGADMEAVASLPGSCSMDAPINEFSKTYLMNIVARAAGININELRAFPIKDATQLTMMAQSFLMEAGSEATSR